MKEQILKANEYYRAEHPNTIIFYKLKEGYTMFGEEVSKVSSLLNIRSTISYGLDSISIPHLDFLDRTENLGYCGIGFCTVTYLNDNGELAIPDAERLQVEKEFDY